MQMRRVLFVAAGVAVAVVALGAANSIRSVASGSGTASPSASEEHVVTIGDSIMAGYGLDSEDRAWPTLLAAKDHFEVTNVACSGAGFINDGDACNTHYDGLVSQAVAAKPTLVIVQSSDNDMGESAGDIQRATSETIEDIHSALPHAEIVGLSTLWDQPGSIPDEVPVSSDALEAAVTAVHGKYVDIGQPIAGGHGLLQSDSEHPTVAGQRVLADAIGKDLAQAGIRLGTRQGL